MSVSASGADAPEADDQVVTEAEPEPELRHGAFVVRGPGGQEVLHATRDQYVDVLCALKADGFELLVDLTGVDYLTYPTRVLPGDLEAERFEVVVNLVSMTDRARTRVRVQVPESDPVLASLYDVFPATEAAEREVFDMFGIRFDGHPDLTRILMPEDWEGHPLRKDHAVGRIPVQFKGAPGPR